MNNNWEIIYSDYSGPQKKAVEFLSKEIGKLTLRDKGAYKIHVLPCYNAKDIKIDNIQENAVIIGTFDDNKIISNFVKKEEIPQDGYVLKVMENPYNTSHNFVIITAINSRELFYGAADFIDDYITQEFPVIAGLLCPDKVFEQKLHDFYKASSPTIKNRNIFTWGHPINDYKAYIDNMARLKFNELIIWNDYVPLNAKDIIEYAHEYEIKVIWGYAWGWSTNCRNIDLENLNALGDAVLKEYENNYKDTKADGIYFQSFTELTEEDINGKCIAEAVTEFVNETAEKFFRFYPELKIKFGLHASSVKNKLKYIKNVNPKVEIIWEDTGEFPCNSLYPSKVDENKFKETEVFTESVCKLRNNSNDGVLFKGNLVLDWGDFVHQKGPFILGMASDELIVHDLEVVRKKWKPLQNHWLKNGEYTYKITKTIYSATGGNIYVGLAAQLAGGIWFPYALLSQILWECDKPYDEILTKVLNRRCIDIV